MSTKSWKSSRRFFFYFCISCSTRWWKLSADINACPGSKYLRVIVCIAVLFLFTSLAKVVKRNKFLFRAKQLSAQKIKLSISRFLRMKCIKALATSSADLPFIASCHNTPVGFKVLDFFQLPATANVSLKRTNLLQNIACFRPGSLGNIITFCISTDIATSCSTHLRFFPYDKEILLL